MVTLPSPQPAALYLEMRWYQKLSVGGCLIVDDYGSFEACRQAVDGYRRREGISEPIQEIEGERIYWRRQG